MVLQTPTPDILITCPLDESHRILKSRMQFHLVRCVKNHTLDKKIRCPWNTLHIVPRDEYLNHCGTCNDLPNVMGSQITMENDGRREVASIPINAASLQLPETDEDWDNETFPSTSYNPLKKLESEPIICGSIGLSKAKRKAHKLAERKRHQNIDDLLPVQIKPPAQPIENNYVPTSCRPPRNRQIAMSAEASAAEESGTCDESSCNDSSKLSVNQGYARRRAAETIREERNKDFKSLDSNYERHSVTLFDTTFDDTTYEPGPYTRNKNINELRALMKMKNASLARAKEMSKRESADAARSDDSVNKLAEQLANLDFIQKRIHKEKAMILCQMLRRGQNIESARTGAPLDSETKEESTNGDGRAETLYDSALEKQQNGASNGYQKCAAKFARPLNAASIANRPTIGAGRGMIKNINIKNGDLVGNGGNRDERENYDSPGPSGANGNGNPSRSSSQNMGSFCGYELDDDDEE